MAAQIIPFSFDTHPVRTLLINDQPWFCVADVCRVLGYANSRDTLSKHCREAGVAKRDIRSSGQTRCLTFIDEGNLYRLIIKSRKEEAQRFEAWVCDDVLPSIRKHGHYDDTQSKMNTLIGQTIGTDGFRCLGAVLDGKVKHLPAPARKSAKHHIWSQVHKAFSVVSAQDIPADQMEAARNFVASYALEGEWLGKQDKLDPELITRMDTWGRVACHRWHELDRLTERQNRLIRQQEQLLEEQREISKLICDVRSNLYDPLFESSHQMRRLRGGAKADDSKVRQTIEMQNRCRTRR